MDRTMKRRRDVAFFLIGFAPLSAQILLIRELLVIFYGNELSLGVMLAAWLLWTSLGSVTLGRLSDGFADKQRVLALIQVVLALLLPLSIIFVRFSKVLFGVPAGEIIDLGRMVIITFIVLAPYCFLSGCLFALACGLDGEARKQGAGVSMGRIFYLEAIGAAAGGVVTSIIFLRYFDHYQAAFIIAALLAGSAASLTFAARSFWSSRGAFALFLSLTVCGAGFLGGDFLDRISRQWEWRGYELMESRDTPYGNITAAAAEGQINFYENGLWLFSCPDPRSAEHAVHFALLQHREPRRVLLVGGGISGSLAEVLKHGTVEQVDYLELDPEIITMGRRLLPETVTGVLDDPRVRVMHRDGRNHVKRARQSYDVVIADLPDPMTAQVNRFYTAEFFAEVQSILSADGVFSLSVTSAETMIGPALASLLASLQKTMESVFDEVVLYPGSAARFFGSPSAGVLVRDPEVLVERVEEREVELAYVRDYYLLFTIGKDRQQFLQRIIASAENVRVNRDLSPSLYYDSLVFWSAQHTPMVARVLRSAGTIDLKSIFIAGILVTGALVLYGRRRSRLADGRLPLIYACFTAGYTGMTLTVLLILCFQVFYGYLYYKIALLLAAYMVGLMAGSRLMAVRLERLADPLRVLVRIQVCLAVYSLSLWAALLVIQGLSPQSWLWEAWERGFPVLLVIAGFLGGLHFPMVGHLYARRGEGRGRTAGLIYGVDLAGSALGALLAGIMLLPGLGIAHTLVVLAFFNIIAGLWLAGERNAVAEPL